MKLSTKLYFFATLLVSMSAKLYKVDLDNIDVA